MMPKRGLVKCVMCGEVGGATESRDTLANFFIERDGKEPMHPIGHAITEIKLGAERLQELEAKISSLESQLESHKIAVGKACIFIKHIVDVDFCDSPGKRECKCLHCKAKEALAQLGEV